MNDLVCLLNTTDRFYFEICKDLLLNNEIEYRERNTVDSMYQNFGVYELYVHSTELEKAKLLIDNTNE
jgi:hypothetical protein